MPPVGRVSVVNKALQDVREGRPRANHHPPDIEEMRMSGDARESGQELPARLTQTHSASNRKPTGLPFSITRNRRRVTRLLNAARSDCNPCSNTLEMGERHRLAVQSTSTSLTHASTTVEKLGPVATQRGRQRLRVARGGPHRKPMPTWSLRVSSPKTLSSVHSVAPGATRKAVGALTHTPSIREMASGARPLPSPRKSPHAVRSPRSPRRCLRTATPRDHGSAPLCVAEHTTDLPKEQHSWHPLRGLSGNVTTNDGASSMRNCTLGEGPPGMQEPSGQNKNKMAMRPGTTRSSKPTRSAKGTRYSREPQCPPPPPEL